MRGAGTKPIDERMRQIIFLEITHGILERTPVIFSMVKEGIIDLLYDHIGSFRAEIVARQLGAHRELDACGSLESFKK